MSAAEATIKARALARSGMIIMSFSSDLKVFLSIVGLSRLTYWLLVIRRVAIVYKDRTRDFLCLLSSWLVLGPLTPCFRHLDLANSLCAYKVKIDFWRSDSLKLFVASSNDSRFWFVYFLASNIKFPKNNNIATENNLVDLEWPFCFRFLLMLAIHFILKNKTGVQNCPTERYEIIFAACNWQ